MNVSNPPLKTAKGNPQNPQPLLKFYWIILIVLFLIIGAVSYYFLFSSAIKKLRDRGELDLKVAQENFEKAKNYLTQLRKTRESLSQIKTNPNLEKLELALPKNLDFAALLVQLEALAVENGLMARNIEITEAPEAAPGAAGGPAVAGPGVGTQALVGLLPPSPPKVKRVNVLMQLGKSDYSSFKSFLQALESNLRLLDLISFNFDPKSDRQTLNLVTYYYKQ